MFPILAFSFYILMAPCSTPFHYRIPKETIAWRLDANDAGGNWPTMESNSQLQFPFWEIGRFIRVGCLRIIFKLFFLFILKFYFTKFQRNFGNFEYMTILIFTRHTRCHHIGLEIEIIIKI